MTTTKEDLTYKVSRWNKLQYETERQESNTLMQREAAGSTRNKRFPDFQREVFARLYNPSTQKLDQPAEGSEWAQALHQLSDQVVEFDQLQERCKGDELWSSMATTIISQSLVAKMKPQESNEDTQQLQDHLDALKTMQEHGVDVGDRMQQAQQKLEHAQHQARQLASGLDPAQIRQAFRRGAEKAQDQIDETEKMISALSWGDRPGQPTSIKNMKQKKELMKKVSSSRKLKQIADFAGRLRRVAANKQRSKSDFAREEINSVEQGSDFARLLPSETLNLMGNEEQQLMFFSRYSDNQCLQYSLKGKEPQGRGPVVICVDESSSMSGSPEAWSKAVALALLEVAQRQKRSWYFIHFNSHVARVDRVEAGKVDPDQLIDCLEFFAGGGTSFDAPLKKAVEVIEQDGAFKQADILFITDGHCRTDPGFNTWLQDKCSDLECSIYSVLVSGVKAGHDMGEWSESIHQLADLVKDSTDRNDFEEFVLST